MATYKEKLLDPRWQRRRLEVLSRSDFTCESCKTKTRTLHVHHKRYVKGRDPWEYSDDELQTLCVDCHEAGHDMRGRLDAALSIEGIGMPTVLGLVEGWVMACCPEARSRFSIINSEHAEAMSWIFDPLSGEDIRALAEADAEKKIDGSILWRVRDHKKEWLKKDSEPE